MTEAFREDVEKLIDKEKTYLWSRALQIASNAEDAEDLLQETLLKACEGYGGFAPDTNFRAWTSRIMINTHINKVKRRKEQEISFDDRKHDKSKLALKVARRISHMDSPDTVFFHNHINEEIMRRYYSLPEMYRLVFSMFHFNGYTYSEISSAMKIPTGTVKSRIHRAKERLSEQMREERYSENALN